MSSRFRYRSSLGYLATLAAVCLAACESTSPKASISHVVLAPSAMTISVGESVRILATVTASPSGATYTVSWSSADSTSASVDSTGLVLGKAASPGTSICATATTSDRGSSTKACDSVVVQPAPLCPEPVGWLTPTADTVHVGDVVQYQIPAALLGGRSASQIRWTIDNAPVAKVDSLSGVVTALGIGYTDVIATDQLSVQCPHRWQSPLVVH